MSAEATVWTLLILFALLCSRAINAAYRNGCCDGYGYSREPNNPGYRHAREYLTKHMTHRWPELKETKCESSKS